MKSTQTKDKHVHAAKNESVIKPVATSLKPNGIVRARKVNRNDTTQIKTIQKESQGRANLSKSPIKTSKKDLDKT